MKKLLVLPLLFLTAFCGEVKIVKATISHYCACTEICCKPFKGKVIGQTASGKMAEEGVTLAAPKNIPFGSNIFVNGVCLGIVQDRGSAIVVDEKGIYHIDVYISSHSKAKTMGRYETTIEIVTP
jgi:3D (Asp-Asp-Asp) domain-containing protein